MSEGGTEEEESDGEHTSFSRDVLEEANIVFCANKTST